MIISRVYKARPHGYKLHVLLFLSQIFGMTFEVVLIHVINKICNIVFECTSCSYMQIIQTVCQVK